MGRVCLTGTTPLRPSAPIIPALRMEASEGETFNRVLLYVEFEVNLGYKRPLPQKTKSLHNEMLLEKHLGECLALGRGERRRPELQAQDDPLPRTQAAKISTSTRQSTADKGERDVSGLARGLPLIHNLLRPGSGACPSVELFPTPLLFLINPYETYFSARSYSTPSEWHLYRAIWSYRLFSVRGQLFI